MEHFFPMPFAFLAEEPLGEKHASKYNEAPEPITQVISNVFFSCFRVS